MLFRQSRSLRHFSNHLLDCSEHLIRLGSSRFSVLRVLTLLKHDSGCFLACLPLAFQSCTLNPAHLLSGHFCTVCMYFLAWFSLTFIFSWSCVSLLCHAAALRLQSSKALQHSSSTCRWPSRYRAMYLRTTKLPEKNLDFLIQSSFVAQFWDLSSWMRWNEK